MKKIKELIPRVWAWMVGIPADKLLHFIVGNMLFILLYSVLTICGLAIAQSIFWSAISVTALASLKELAIDEYDDIMDVAWTLLGIAWAIIFIAIGYIVR